MFFYNSLDVGKLLSGSSAFSKSNLYIWKFLVQELLKPGLENFEMTFSSPVATAEFSKFAGILTAALSQHHLSGFEIFQDLYSVLYIKS